MKDEKEYLTKDKYEQFEQELKTLKGEKRKEIADSLEYAKSLGDLSENAEYHEARDAQAAVEDRIGKLEALLKSAVIVSSIHTKDVASVGSRVSVVKDGDKETKSFTIVGTEESDIAKGKISVKSPLGGSVIGKRKGETFSVDTPKGAVKYKLVNIE